MSSRSKVLMLGAGPLQVPAIKVVKDLGFEVIALDYDPVAPGFSICDGYEVISTTDIPAVLEYARKNAPDYVITSTSDAPVKTAAFVSEELGLPCGISYADAICATEKDEMRKRLSSRGIPMPDYHVCRDFKAFSDAVLGFDGCCVIKPADCAASRGVKLLNGLISTSELRELFARTVKLSGKNVVMVEERITGPEVSVEALTIKGETTVLAITDKMVTNPPYLVELGHTEPSLLPADICSSIAELTQATVAAIGIVDGPSHTEIMLSADGPKIIETAARLGGDYIAAKLVPLSTGVDFVSASVRLSLGLDVDIKPTHARGAAIRFIVAEQCGSIGSIDIDSRLCVSDGIAEFELYRSVGDAIDYPHSSNDRIGHIIFTGDNAHEAAKRADKGLAKVSVTIA